MFLPDWLKRFFQWPQAVAKRARKHPYALVVTFTSAALVATGLSTGWQDLLTTPDQRGPWFMQQGRYREAAAAFQDPMWKGVANFRAGEFKDAATLFGGIDSAEAAYNQGNADVMLGRYEDAIGRYQRALESRPGWSQATTNLELARVRAERMKLAGGQTGDVDSKPDDVVFDQTKKNNVAENVDIAGGPAMDDEAVRALWLRRVQTKPADFLRAKFAYQLSAAEHTTSGTKP